MSLKLSWNNPNVVPTRVRIYRKDTDFDSSTLPAPLVELTNGETTWIDPTAVDGNSYYYVLGSKTDTDEVFTASQKILVADNRGVGSSTILHGDASLGYMDSILSVDFVNSSTILAAALNASGLPVALVQPTWHKFIRNNKIIYVPDQQFGTASFPNLYRAGFVYGTDSVGPEGYPTAGLAAPVNQLRIIEFKGQKYKIRLMRGWSDGVITDVNNWASTGQSNMDLVPEAQNNEYSDLIYSLAKFVPLKQRTPNWLNLSVDPWLGAPLSSYDSATINSWRATFRVLCQERRANGNIFTRSMRECTLNQNQGSPNSKANLTYVFLGDVNQATIWIPVLELVEQTATL
ncbi:putative virion structural protein [Erwinia phage phiEaH2]|uniref:Putative virion structural protein n=1 Tax=Erwinia phage phiEaH2 TaxID=1029988 RepID=J7KKH5_9CAUD|nr:putative virion structural protein [Erwinia phage phiEaH2]AFQ96615.1 putative virion structural protein [Erwinia phage phiEaH2]